MEFEAIRDTFDGELRSMYLALLGGIAVVPDPAYDSSTVEARAAQAAQWGVEYQVDAGGAVSAQERNPARRILPWL